MSTRGASARGTTASPAGRPAACRSSSSCQRRRSGSGSGASAVFRPVSASICADAASVAASASAERACENRPRRDTSPAASSSSVAAISSTVSTMLAAASNCHVSRMRWAERTVFGRSTTASAYSHEAHGAVSNAMRCAPAHAMCTMSASSTHAIQGRATVRSASMRPARRARSHANPAQAGATAACGASTWASASRVPIESP